MAKRSIASELPTGVVRLTEDVHGISVPNIFSICPYVSQPVDNFITLCGLTVELVCRFEVLVFQPPQIGGQSGRLRQVA